MAEPRRVVWRVEAVADLRTALDFIAADSVEAAERAADAIFERAASLETFPERGRLVPELHPRTIREVFASRYRIFYTVDESQVTIIGVLDTARDFTRWIRSRTGLD